MLSTVHATRGVDAVPVVFAIDGGRILVPVDSVKPKSGRPLQRLANLRADARCVMLASHYDADWSGLWWVRVHGSGAAAEDVDAAPLVARYPQYASPGSIEAVIVITPTLVTGWAAGL